MTLKTFMFIVYSLKCISLECIVYCISLKCIGGMTPRSERFNGQPAVFANLAAASNKSRLHGELVPVLGEIELLADCVQGRRHLRKSSGDMVLTLMPYPLVEVSRNVIQRSSC